MQTQQGERSFDFDARNSQFQALYLDEFKSGYEPEVAATLDALLPDAGVFFDIGSNFGYFSVLTATRPGFTGKVHAFEPFAASHRDVTKLVAQAGLGEYVTVHQVALSDADGNARMNLPDHIHSGLATMQTAAANDPGAVKMACLDQLNLPTPDVMKIDAEGSEVAILRGARETLAKARPHVLFESLRQFANPAETLAPLRLLRDTGYQFFQPVWRRTTGEIQLLQPSDGNHGALSEETLVLAPLPVEDRFLRQDQINILAVHASRLGELEKVFTPAAAIPA